MPIIAKCRFCGRDPNWGTIFSESQLHCPQCNSCGPSSMAHSEAIDGWNLMHGVSCDFPDSDNTPSVEPESDSAARFQQIELD